MNRVLGAALALGMFVPELAEACGCFAQPNAVSSVVQAGERIVFAHDGDKVVAHIQIQYQGEAEEFAWLVPVPARPELRLGTEEIFAALEADTVPSFALNRPNCGGGGIQLGCSENDTALVLDGGLGNDVEAELSSAGPYEYAVIQADAKAPLLEWLNEHRYFVPDAVSEVLDPYIHSGAYFLALRLRAGETTGAIQPVVLEYPSDRPMIPLILTSASAVPDMGILVWVLGEQRAIPVNYAHVTLNEAYIDWFGADPGYGAAVARAVDEAPDGHAFVTDFADIHPDTARRLRWSESLNRQRIAAAPNEAALRDLTREMPREARDQVLQGFTGAFDPVAITDELWTRLVEPTQEAAALLDDNRYVTRLYTTLDPSEMTRDPVFAFNPSLPAVGQIRFAEVDSCDDSGTLTLRDDRQFSIQNGQPVIPPAQENQPRAQTVSMLRLEGEPELIQDNRPLLRSLNDGGGCRTLGRNLDRASGILLLLGLALYRRSRRRA